MDPTDELARLQSVVTEAVRLVERMIDRLAIILDEERVNQDQLDPDADAGTQKGAIHHKNAARRKSRLMKQLHTTSSS